MKKWLKRIGIVIAVILILIGGAGAYISISGIPKYEVKKVELKVESTPARVERGGRIVRMLCVGCHLDPATGGLTGHFLPDIPAVFGKVYSRNITQDPTYGIGKWSDADIAYLIRTGVKPSGDYVPPYMVKLPHLSDEDMSSVISYLRSNDSLVRARPVPDSDCVPSFLVKFLSRVAFKPYEYPTAPIPSIPISDRVAYGRYMVNSVSQCFSCHSADFKTNDDFNPEKSVGYLGGGNEMLDILGKPIRTANITMDVKTGIGSWSEKDFMRAVKEGFRPDGRVLQPPMEKVTEMTDDEIDAIWQYLKTAPVIVNQVQRATLTDATASAGEGEKTYYKYGCYTCHGKDGVGYCDLTVADAKYASDSDLTNWIRDPSKLQPGSKMPTWNGTIKETEYPALCAYVRQLGKDAAKKRVAQK